LDDSTHLLYVAGIDRHHGGADADDPNELFTAGLVPQDE
jgi:hypothetical protein